MKHLKSIPAIIFVVFCSGIFLGDSHFLLRGADSVSRTTEAGLHTILFKTSAGEIAVNLPEDMAGGEQVSGRITLLPSGKKQGKQDKNLEKLREYSLEIAGQKPGMEMGWGKWLVPQGDMLSLTLSDAKGKMIARTQAPVFETATLSKAGEFRCSPYAPAGGLIHLYGKFDGDFSNTLVWIGDKKTSLRAETARRVIFTGPEEPIGLTTFKFMEGESGGECRYHNILLETSVGKAVIKKGKETELYISATGLEGLREKIPVTIENLTPDVVEMKGSGTLFIRPADVQAGGLYAYKTQLTAIKSGRITIRARLMPWLPDTRE
ncbi:MAG: hypothetical protein KAT34_14705 [Candidatus Aminicenantes bacterium]|nr:hypothetical protein [Candidatus Aminicenantes bacterium]